MKPASRAAVAALLAVGAFAPGALALQDPAPPRDEAAEAEAAAAAAREKAAEAALAARVAEEKAHRARRRALERDLADREAVLDAAREGKDATAIREAEAAVGRAEQALATHLQARFRVAAPARVPAAAPRRTAEFRPAAGLPALQPRPLQEGPAAVAAGLDWLARHQSPEGGWDCDGHAARCTGATPCPGAGNAHYDVGVTGLALSAFLRSGETHRTPKYGQGVEDGLKYLKGTQDPEGCFGSRHSNHFIYNHALATTAMAEAYGLTQSPLFRDSAKAGVDFLLQAQNPYLGWRYGVRPQDNDTSVTSWCVLALRAAKDAGLEVPESAFLGALAWLDKVTDPEFGRAGYTARGNGPARPQELIDAFPTDKSEGLTAAAAVMRLLSGQKADQPILRKGLDLCSALPPAWQRDGSIDFYYWYFGTLAHYHAKAEGWVPWQKAVGEALFPHQRGEESGCARGSWDPVDPWGNEGGRVYATAINTLTAELHGRYAKAFGGGK